MKSRLLVHPLAADAGGDHFHNGGKHWLSQTNPEWQTLAAWVGGKPPVAMASTAAHAPAGALRRTASPTAKGAPGVRIIQTNSAGDNVSIIDPATNTVVGEITGIEVNHGAAVAPGGARIYVSNEADSTLDVADGKRSPSRSGSRSAVIRTTSRSAKTGGASTSPVRGVRGLEPRLSGRCEIGQGNDARPGRRSAEAEHHGDPAVRPVVYSTIACMTAFSKSRIS